MGELHIEEKQNEKANHKGTERKCEGSRKYFEASRMARREPSSVMALRPNSCGRRRCASQLVSGAFVHFSMPKMDDLGQRKMISSS